MRKQFFEEGKTISQISRETGFDRKTIRAYIAKQDFNQDITPPAKPLFFSLEPYKACIDTWLTDDRKAKRKQRHTAKRVFDRLKKEFDDFKLSYRTVAGYVSLRKKEIFSKTRGYLPLEHIPGEAQVDFGDCQFYERQRLYEGKYLNLSFPASNKGYLQVFKGENIQCLLEGLISIFSHIGGVPSCIWFDNASSAVSKVLKEGARNLTDKFLKFKAHYGFEAVFCNIGAGHEKGSVEAKVGYHRRNMLVPVPRFDNICQFNKELLAICEEDGDRNHYRKEATHNDLFEKDRNAFLKLSASPFDASRYEKQKTNGYGKFILDGLYEYSVSPKYADCYVMVRITANTVAPLDDSLREITVHERLYGASKQSSMNWLPYLTQLARFPGALKYTGVYKMLPDPLREYLDKLNRSQKGKILSAIAAFSEKSGFEAAVDTVSEALQYHITDVDSLTNLHSWLNPVIAPLKPLKLSPSVPELKKYTPQLSLYDRHLSKAGER
ncbi:MAG: IS21 family transposase [Actinobacteria bacterium]|nr:IS21 family transposase [Actinomycetota bacterium]